MKCIPYFSAILFLFCFTISLSYAASEGQAGAEEVIAEMAKKYSGCNNYVHINRAAIAEMFRQVGLLELDDRGMAIKGLIVRHLVLPGGISGSEGIFEFLSKEVSPDVYVSLMSQYFPAYKAPGDTLVNRRITPGEFNTTLESFEKAGLANGFIQYMENETA